MFLSFPLRVFLWPFIVIIIIFFITVTYFSIMRDLLGLKRHCAAAYVAIANGGHCEYMSHEERNICILYRNMEMCDRV